MNGYQAGVTVIVCCYNSAPRLKETLSHLAKQESTGGGWEIILIDNASIDNTSSAAGKVWQELGQPTQLTILQEQKPGKSNALKKGLEAAQFSFIIICDDDNWLSPNYIRIAYELMINNEKIGIIGAHSEVVADGPIPEWFHKVKYHYACGAPAKNSADLTGNTLMWSAGMVFKTVLMKQIFSEEHPLLLTGRKGALLISGEDDEFCLRAWLLGAETHFNANLFFNHYMPPSRLTQDYYKRLVEGFQHQAAIINSYKRVYEVSRMMGYEKVKSLFINILRLAKCIISPSSIRKESAKEYIFFIMGLKWLGDKNTTAIRNFYRYAKVAINKTNFQQNSEKFKPR
jgi:glycosyltransferase involved in cell wall biosynthesis